MAPSVGGIGRLQFDSDGFAGLSGPSAQVNDQWALFQLRHAFSKRVAIASDQQDLRMCEQLIQTRHQPARKMWNALLDVVPVRAADPRSLNRRVVNLQIVALANKMLGDEHNGTFPEVVGAVLESQS